jgi:hypothetical protein
MAVRRAAFERLHGFDERLGAGTPVGSGEDLDIAMRSLLAGYSVHETPAAAVTHLGFRAWPEAPPAIEGYMRGLGATYAKMVRLGGVEAVVPVLALAWRWLARGPVVDLNHRPPRLDRLRAFLGGARWAWGMGLHSSTGWFADRPLAARLALDADRVSRVSTRAQPLPGAGD